MILGLLLTSVAGTANVDSNATVHGLLQDTVLVQGRVSEVRGGVDAERPELVSYIISIEHRYCGKVDGANDTFTFEAIDLTRHSGGGLSREIDVTPTLRVGEELFWRLRVENDQLVPLFDYHFGVVWPVRATGACGDCMNGVSIFADPRDPDAPNPLFPRVRLLAEALEKVWNADTEAARIELLKFFAHGEVPEVSLMAIELLHNGAPQAFVQFVADLNPLILPLKSQVAVDEAMLRIDKHAWKVSEQRKKLINGWIVSVLSADDTEVFQLLGWLESAAQHGNIEARSVLNIIRPILTGEPRLRGDAVEFPILLRIKAIIVLQTIPDTPDVRKQAFALLIALLDEDVDVRLRRSAAMALAKFSSITPEELSALETWRDFYNDLAATSESRADPARELATILDQIIQAAYERQP